MSHYNDYVLSSPPMDIDFLGFRGNSVELQRRGWMFSFEREHHRNVVRIAMKNANHNLVCLTNHFDMERRDPREMRGQIHQVQVGNYFGQEIRIMSHQNPFASFKAIDAEPAMLTMKEWAISGADIFRRIEPLVEEKKLFLAEAGEMDLLKTLMEKQQPKQDEIRERLRLQRLREDVMPHQIVEAQVIRLANWR